jgi:hypothetical protein
MADSRIGKRMFAMPSIVMVARATDLHTFALAIGGAAPKACIEHIESECLTPFPGRILLRT